MTLYTSTFTDPDLEIGGRPPISSSAPVTVYTKDRWTESWTIASDIYPLQVTWRSGESGIGIAEFLVRYGKRINGATGFSEYISPIDRMRHFIKVEFDDKVWVGQITAQVDQPFGFDNGLEAGAQNIQALAMESVFHHQFVTETRYVHYEVSDEKARFDTILRGMTFNTGGYPNQAAQAFPTTYRYFTSPNKAKWWSTREIIYYALQNWVPKTANGQEAAIAVTMDAADAARLPNWDRPILETHGYRPIEIINRLVTRRRLLMWWLELDESTPSNPIMKFRTATLTDASVADSEGNAIIANDRLFIINTDKDASAEVVIEEDANSQVDFVKIQGARRRNVLTLAFQGSETYARGSGGWSEEDEILYESGGSTLPNYPAAEKRGERRAFHARFRARPRFENVFAKFKIRRGERIPPSDPFYVIAESERILLPTLPLFAIPTVDYSGDNIANGNSNYDAIVERVYSTVNEMPMVVFLKINTPEYGVSPTYVDASKIGRTDDVPTKNATDNYDFSCSVRVIEGEDAFRIDVIGDEQHILSSAPQQVAVGTPGYFEPLKEDKNIGNIDWTEMLATVCVEDDRYCEAQYPLTSTGWLPARVLLINAGEEYRKDWVEPDTAVDVDQETGQVITSNGGWFRDDTLKLQSIARRAAEYYVRTRRIMRMQIDYQKPSTSPDVNETPFRLGSFIQSYSYGGKVQGTGVVTGSKTINSVVSQITVAFPIQESDIPIPRVGRPSISIITDFGELDPAFFVSSVG